MPASPGQPFTEPVNLKVITPFIYGANDIAISFNPNVLQVVGTNDTGGNNDAANTSGALAKITFQSLTTAQADTSTVTKLNANIGTHQSDVYDYNDGQVTLVPAPDSLAYNAGIDLSVDDPRPR